MKTGVRIAALKEKPAAMRRRPVQSRAYASSQALQEAFVRVLIEQGFDKTTIREVTAVAGVGIGTFYDYFGNMDALAALCIHRRMKALGLAARSVAAEQADRRLLAIAHGVADTYALSITGELKTWVALFRLERQISTPKAFHKQYAAHVEIRFGSGRRPAGRRRCRSKNAILHHIRLAFAVFDSERLSGFDECADKGTP